MRPKRALLAALAVSSLTVGEHLDPGHLGRNTATGVMFAERWTNIANTLAVTIVT